MLNTAQIMLDMSQLPSTIKDKTRKHHLTYLLSLQLVQTQTSTHIISPFSSTSGDTNIFTYLLSLQLVETQTSSHIISPFSSTSGDRNIFTYNNEGRKSSHIQEASQ
ncbi:hypothetical protein BsWGS_06354 [Bradybaena similaris]